MTDSLPAEPALNIDRVHGSRPSVGEIRLALSGHWRNGHPRRDDEPLLVVQIEGRRHRFPAERSHLPEGPEADTWTATFAVPDWAEPRQEGQAALWIGNQVIPVPPLNSGPSGAGAVSERPRPRRAPHPSLEPPPPAGARVTPGEPPAGHASPFEPARSGPLADLLLKETVTALHSELEQRTSEAARLRGELSDAQSELEARIATQGQLETTLGELGTELKRLMEAVEEQRQELDRRGAENEHQLDELRDQHSRQLGDLREQHERELSDLRDQHERRLAELDHDNSVRLADLTRAGDERVNELMATAERQAADLAAARQELAAAQVSRDTALSEVSGLQAELSRVSAELAVTRERVNSESGDLGEANRLLADAKALAARLRASRPPD